MHTLETVGSRQGTRCCAHLSRSAACAKHHNQQHHREMAPRCVWRAPDKPPPWAAGHRARQKALLCPGQEAHSNCQLP